MKRFLITFVWINSLCFLAQAQDVTLGLKAGINISGWHSNAADVGARLAYHFGGVVQYTIQTNLSARGELVYSVLGVRSTDPSTPARNVQNYITLPLLLEYDIGTPIKLQAGLQPAFLLSSKQVYTSGSENRKYDVADEFSSFDLALTFGGEYEFRDNLSAGVRAAFGITDIAIGEFEMAKNQVLQLSVRYVLGHL